jgi:DNA-binding GntR family transcriptional regulator
MGAILAQASEMVYHYSNMKIAGESKKLDSTVNTADGVVVSLRERITGGQFEPGERLVERDLADQFGVSRIPMREAIQQLEREGLVEIFRNRGAIVRMLSEADVNEIYDLRVLLEGDAIYRSVKRMEEETLARAELVHRLLGSANSKARQGELNREFHELLYAHCGNERQLKAIKELRAQVERYERLQHTLLDDTPSFQVEHEAILHACLERNARAARSLTVAHLDSARRIVTRRVAAE